ncbi:MAG TPA: GerMN domain-containing protein [Acidobacteriaceae bacterium]|nr:GerMN domain-containing protein [Acidobacteriaceae bacterium]
MIPRWQQSIFWILLISVVGMAAFLIRLREGAQDRLLAVQDAVPLASAINAQPVPVTLMLAKDSDGSLEPVQTSAMLPAETTSRARALLVALFREYAVPESPHPLAPLPAVLDVYLLPLPMPPGQAQTQNQTNPDEMAVVNLSGNFVAHHPSGIEVEALTLLSVANTLHANLPQITQVHFLVDGQLKDTLAGHADLTQNYLATGNPAESSVESRP